MGSMLKESYRERHRASWQVVVLLTESEEALSPESTARSNRNIHGEEISFPQASFLFSGTIRNQLAYVKSPCLFITICKTLVNLPHFLNFKNSF